MRLFLLMMLGIVVLALTGCPKPAEETPAGQPPAAEEEDQSEALGGE